MEDWNSRDLRILEIVAQGEAGGFDRMNVRAVAEDLGLELADTIRGLDALYEADYMALARPTGVGSSCTHVAFQLIAIDGAAEWEAAGLRSA